MLTLSGFLVYTGFSVTQGAETPESRILILVVHSKNMIMKRDYATNEHKDTNIDICSRSHRDTAQTTSQVY